MSDNFLRCVTFTLRQDIEGGLVDDPRDPGGITNMGLTIADLTVWERHRATAEDVRDLTREEAVVIYRAIYWNAMKGAGMPAGVALMVFDHGVNRGVGRSVRLLQTALGVVVDGLAGPQTLSALTVATYQDQRPMIETLHTMQRDDYIALGNPVYQTGWLARADKRRDAAVTLLTGTNA